MYQISRTKLFKEDKTAQQYIISGYVIMIILEIIMLIVWAPFFWHIFVIAIGVAFIVFGNSMKKEINQKNKMYDKLERSGYLVKGLKYTAKSAGVMINQKPAYKIIAQYPTENGKIMRLEGDDLFERSFLESNHLADVLIDTENPKNYFVGFNITQKYDYVIKEEKEEE